MPMEGKPYDPDYDEQEFLGFMADEQSLDDARNVMRKRFPEKKHWMLMDTRAEQERWDRQHVEMRLKPVPPTAVYVFMAFACGLFFFAIVGFIHTLMRMGGL